MRPVDTPARHISNLPLSGWMHSANRIILKGHPYRIALTGIRPTFNPCIRSDDVMAVEYSALTHANHGPIPYACRVRKRYCWEIRSKACAKSRLSAQWCLSTLGVC
jgi:hypothetical protein